MTATWHLDRLAAALAKAGWRTEPRYDEEPPQRRVWHPGCPEVGASVRVTATADDRLWFQASDHRMLAPVGRPGVAAIQMIALLNPFSGPDGP